MKRALILAALLLLLAAVILLVPFPVWRYWSSFVLLWVVPGLAWIPFLNRSGVLNTEERITVALGLNFVITPIVVLSLAYLPGELTRELLLIAILAAALVPIIWNGFRQEKGADKLGANMDRANFSLAQPWWKTGWLWLAVILLLAAAVRLVNLDYSEFQGDEAAVLVKSARIIVGEDDVLFQHKKGPAELLVALAGWQLTGITSEWMSRLAFSWASILGVAGVFLYAYRQSSLITAILAAGMLVIEGYLVGFGRIVQYQSLVFLTSTLALLCLLIYIKSGKGILVIIAAAFFAVGSWAHYDAVLFIPAGFLLVANYLAKERQNWRSLLPHILIGGFLGLLLVGYFYLPFSRSSQAEGTLFYVTGRIGSGQIFYNHLLSTFNRTFVYDSIFLLGLIFGGLALQILVTWKRWGRVAAIVAAGLMLAAMSTLIRPEWWEIGDRTWAWMIMGILLLGSLAAPKQAIGTRAIWLWLGVPVMFYLYFVALPLTHVYTAVPGAILLAAMGLAGLYRYLAKWPRISGRMAVGLTVGLFTLGLAYIWVAFVNHTPEYVREYPDSKSRLFWTPFGDDLPDEGLFGFPYRAGWKTVGFLFDSGQLTGSYDSNEERDVTDYYTRQAMRFDCATPDSYITAENVQDEVDVRIDQIESEFHPSLVVTVDRKPKLTIHQRDLNDPPNTISDHEYAAQYDLGTSPEAVAEASPAIAAAPPGEFFPLQAQVGDFAQLAGYQLDTSNAHPGGYVELLLLWEALGPAVIDYQVFTHLHDGQVMRGQLDGQPVCNSAPTSRWQEGSFVVDPYRIPIHPDAAAGSVPLTVGMYDLATLQRLPITVSNDENPRDAIFLTDVEIAPYG